MNNIPLLQFIWAVANNWAGYMTGGLIVAAVALWAAWKDTPVPRNVALALAALFLFFAFYEAWKDQYDENRIGREVGSLAFVNITGELNQRGNLADPQLQITLKNVQPRLLSYEVEKLDLIISGQQQEQLFLNRGGYVYAGQETHYRLHPVKNVLLIPQAPLSGRLSYSIAYHINGSKQIHHTKKTISFDLYHEPPLGGKHSILEAHED